MIAVAAVAVFLARTKGGGHIVLALEILRIKQICPWKALKIEGNRVILNTVLYCIWHLRS